MRRGEILALGAAILAIVFYALAQGSDALVLFANYGLVAYMAVAASIGIFTYLKLGSSRMGDLTLGYALGLLTWVIGLAIYAYTYLIAGADLPYLSIADVFYLLSYPAWMITAVRMLRVFGRAVARNDQLIHQWMFCSFCWFSHSSLRLGRGCLRGRLPSWRLGRCFWRLVTWLIPS
jgi:hypothetical protein